MRPKKHNDPLLSKTPLSKEQRDRLRKAVIEGCHDMADVMIEMEREYHPLEEEVQRMLDLEDDA